MTARFFLALVMFLGVLLALAGPAGAGDGSAFVLLSASSYDDVLTVIRDIEASGGHVRHIFPNVALVADGVGASLAEHTFVEEVRFGEFAVDDILRSHGEKAWLAARAWLGAVEPAAVTAESEWAPGPIENDALPRAASRDGEDAYYPTSEYMAGTVAIGLILPECTGGACTEAPWTADQLAQVFSEVVGAMDWWIDRAAEDGVPLTFVYDQGQPRVVPTTYEPIGMNAYGSYCGSPKGRHLIWVEDVLHALGYPGSCFELVYGYLGDMSGRLRTSWSLAVFVANSLADADGMFPDGRFAFAWLGGPLFVMTYDNDGYGAANCDAVAAHELGHMFWAQDQYLNACGCVAATGYLRVQNQNCKLASGSCLSNVPSIMRGQISPFLSGSLDSYGAGQIGWWDTDEDGLQDVIDTRPAVALDAYTPDPTPEHELEYSGQAFDVPLQNINPASWNPQIDITVNTIQSVLFRVDAGEWAAATPTDGAFDDSLEQYTFTTPPLDPGVHVIEATSVNSVGNYAESTASDTVTVMAAPVQVYVDASSAGPENGTQEHPFNTIAEGILTVADGGTVYVATGLYAGDGNRDLNFGGKGISVIGVAGPDSTVIDCGGAPGPHHGFIFGSGEDAAAVVDGFTIRNGYGIDAGGDYGGAIQVDGSSPTLRRLILRDNHGTHGGGMYLGESAATIEDAVFFRNQADATGGAVYCWSASPADPAPSFSGVTFVENRADHGSGYGGTVDCGGASVHITESILAFTMSNQVVSCRNGAQPTITHCFSYGNALGDSLCGNHHDNVFEDPLFCDLGNGDLTLQDGSPCLPENNIWGVQIGAYAAGGCGTGIPAVPVPSPLLLVSATPNPSPGSARIECDIPVGVGSVRVVIYDPTGRCVRVLSDGPAQPGRSSMVWNGADDAGRPAASGVYFCRVTAGSEEASAKIVLVR